MGDCHSYCYCSHALFCQKKYQEAVEAYELGLELDPENATIKQSLATAKSKIGSVDRSGGDPSTGAGGMPDLGALLNNPALMGMAQQMMQSGALDQLMNNPNLARMYVYLIIIMDGVIYETFFFRAQNMMGGNGGAGGAPNIAEMMQNPEMMEM